MAKVNATIIRDGKEKFLPQAKKKGGLLGTLLVRESLFDIKLEYKPYYRVVLPHEIETRKFIFNRKKINGTLDVIVDAQSEKCAVQVDSFETAETEAKIFLDGRDMVDEPRAVEVAKHFASRILHRMLRGIPQYHDITVEVFYRPHWIAYYGDPATARQPRYLPFEADGLTVGR